MKPKVLWVRFDCLTAPAFEKSQGGARTLKPNSWGCFINRSPPQIMPLANILSKIASCCLIFPFVALFFILLPYFSLCFILLPFFPYVSFCCLNLRHVCIMFASWVHYAASWVHYAASWVHYAASWGPYVSLICVMSPLCCLMLQCIV